MLAWLWADDASFTDYLSDLLVDRRGGRKGFPIEVLADLHKLHALRNALLYSDRTATWDEPALVR